MDRKKTLFILCGVSGDLSKRKLIPALYHLYVQGYLRQSVFLGISRDSIAIQALLEEVRPFIERCDITFWTNFAHQWHYIQASIDDHSQMALLTSSVITLEKKYSLSGYRILYAAVGANLFEPLIINAAETNLIQKKEARDLIKHIIIFEKPFGTDFISAHQINKTIEKYYHESQVFRIDHYLTKEIVSNIALIRFTNLFFQPLWNNTYIEQVNIILNETLTIGNRGLYYDKFGALSDVVQNHMLQLLALVAMDSPSRLTNHAIGHERRKILEKVQFRDGLLGQYDGYTKELHVDPTSKTETAATLLFFIDHPRWENVPFILSTAKAVQKKKVGIYIKFKAIDCLLTKGCPTDSNWLVIELAPERRFYITLNVKKAGVADELIQTVMEINSVINGNTIFGTVSYEPYENLLRALLTDQEVLSIGSQEIEFAWKIIDMIKSKNLPLYLYQQKSNGPVALNEFFKQWNCKDNTIL